MVEWFAIDPHIGSIGFLTGVVRAFAFYCHTSGIEPRSCFATRAIAESGEKLVEAARRHADIGRVVGLCRKNEVAAWIVANPPS